MTLKETKADILTRCQPCKVGNLYQFTEAALEAIIDCAFSSGEIAGADKACAKIDEHVRGLADTSNHAA